LAAKRYLGNGAAIQAEEIEMEYRRRKTIIENLAALSPAQQDIGDEKIYRLVLREVTGLLTGMSVGRAAVYCGYPIPDAPYTSYGNATMIAPGIHIYALDMSGSVQWAKRMLEALAGKGGIFVSWRLSKASTFGGDVILLSLH
jgi:hypothetical protein